MQLNYGSGNAMAILDLASCQVEMYNKGGLEGNPFHARFGGRQYYASLSGLSGSGWIPDRPDIRPVGVLRADVSRPAVPSRAEALPGTRVVVCTAHLQRDEQLPLLVIRDREVAVVYPDQLREALLGTLELEHSQEVNLTSWVKASDKERMVERRLDIKVAWGDWKPSRWGKLSLRRVLELLFWNELFQKEASAVYRRSYEPFWEDLGLHRSETDGRLYRSVGGILRHKVEGDIASLEAETGQKFWSVGEDRNILVRVDNSDTGEFRLRHSAETDWKSSRSGVRPLRLGLADALEIFSSASVPPSLVVELEGLQAPSPIVARSTSDESGMEIMPDWERELLGVVEASEELAPPAVES